jgi:hypothetical protein
MLQLVAVLAADPVLSGSLWSDALNTIQLNARPSRLHQLVVYLAVAAIVGSCQPAPPPTPVSADVPSALPLSLLTPQATPTMMVPRMPIRVENPRVPFAAVVKPTGGTVDRVEIPTLTAGYWTGSPGLGQNGNTIIIGFESAGIFLNLRATKPGDRLLVTDQHGLTTTYQVTEVGPSNAIIDATQLTTAERLTLIGISPTTITFFRVEAIPLS